MTPKPVKFSIVKCCSEMCKNIIYLSSPNPYIQLVSMVLACCESCVENFEREGIHLAEETEKREEIL